MSEWKEYKLGDCVEMQKGFAFKSSDYINKGIKIIKVSNLNQNRFDDSSCVFISPISAELYSRYSLFEDDIIISTVGSWPTNPESVVGKVCRVPKIINGSLLNQNAVRLRVKNNFNQRFLYYVLSGSNFSSFIANTAQGSANQASITLEDIRSFKFFSPSKKDQDKIVSILSSLDDKIEVNRRINEQLEELAQALFKSWFVDFEPFKDGEFVESELGMIPKGWKVGTLGDIISEQKIKVGNRDDVKVLSPITTGDLVLSEEFFTKQVYSKSIAKYLVVKPLDFAYNPARVNIGSLGMNEFDFDGCVSPVYVVFRCKEGYNYFFDLYRKRQSFKDEVISRAIGGVRQTLGYKDFSMISVVYPPIEIVKDFNQTYIRLKDVIAHNQQEILHLTTLRDTLLPKLMSGEIDVTTNL